MNIGELAINLGVKGGDNAKKELQKVKGGLEDVKSMSLEAKAAIVGALYGLERLMGASMKQGMHLRNFSEATGLSTKRIQQWDYAARQAGVSAEEMESSLVSVQDKMVAMLQGEGAPKGIAMFADYMAKIGQPIDMKKVRDMEYMLPALQKFSQSAPPDILRGFMGSMGVGMNMFGAMRQNSFREDVYKRAPILNNGQVNANARAGALWADLQSKFEQKSGQFTAEHGEQLIKALSDLMSAVFKLSDIMLKVAENLNLFGLPGKAIDGVGKMFDMSGKQDSLIGVKRNIESLTMKDVKGMGSVFMENMQRQQKNMATGFIKYDMNAITKNKPAQTITNNVNMQFQHDGKDAKKVGTSTTQAMNKVYRQSQAQKQRD